VTGEFSFLPIHAAGIYRGDDRQCLSDYAVSSYVPTLSALIKARENWNPVARAAIAGLVVSEPSTGTRFLRHVESEANNVRSCFNSASAQILNPSATHMSVSELRSLLRGTTAHVLHLACHGIQDADALKSSFILGDGNLSIEHIMELNLPHAALAYLSACHTAKGSKNQPDQSAHLAASMLFCGFRSVIGTMW
jgi:CHAT domain-containing protein